VLVGVSCSASLGGPKFGGILTGGAFCCWTLLVIGLGLLVPRVVVVVVVVDRTSDC